jgi:hypothetical protein
MEVALSTDVLLDVLDRIDLGWQEGQPVPIPSLLKDCGLVCSAEQVAEILAVDSEWRWRRAGYRFDPCRSWIPEEASERDPRPVEHYLASYPELNASRTAAMILIESEFLSRSEWGNPPLISEFANRFREIPDLAHHLVQLLDNQSPWVVHREEKEVAGTYLSNTAAVRTPLTIGRRSLQEIDAPWITDDRHRVLVADNQQIGVSREHARLVRISLDRCLVSNASSQGEMSLGGSPIAPGETRQMLIPVMLDIGDCRLRIDHW